MPSKRRTVEVEVVVDDKKARANLDGLAGKTTKTGKSFSDMGALVKTGLAVFGASEMLQALGKLDELNTKMAANEERAETVFGNMADDARQWADDQNEAFGLGENALLGLASNMQDLLVPMGFARAQAFGLTQDALTLANALDDWKGGILGVENATDRIIKGMLGEREGLVELGIKISEADVKTRLLEKGQQDLTGTALDQAKATATLELITEKAADAMAQYNDRAGTAVAKNKELEASTADLGEEFARTFGPALEGGKTALIGVLRAIGPSGFEALRRFFGLSEDADKFSLSAQDLEDNMASLEGELAAIHNQQKLLAESSGKAVPSVEALAFAMEREADSARAAREAILDQRRALLDIHDPLGRAWRLSRDLEEAQGAAADAAKKHGKNSDEYVDAALRAADVTADLEATLVELKSQGIDPTGEAARLMLSGLGLPDHVIDAIFAQFDEIEQNFEGRRFNMHITIPDLNQSSSGNWYKSGSRSFFHEGGTVPGTPGENVPAVLQAGEEVIRRSEANGGGGGVTINVHGSVWSENALLEKLRSELIKIQRRNGSTGLM